jgi:hypothetical protein
VVPTATANCVMYGVLCGPGDIMVGHVVAHATSTTFASCRWRGSTVIAATQMRLFGKMKSPFASSLQTQCSNVALLWLEVYLKSSPRSILFLYGSNHAPMIVRVVFRDWFEH